MPLQHPATHDSFRKVTLNNTPPSSARFLMDVGASEGDPDIQGIEYGAFPDGLGGGQANTLTSVGTGAGVLSLVEGKVDVDLQVRGVASLAVPLVVALDAANKRVTFDLTIGTASDTLAAGDHDHAAAYAALGHDHAAAYAALGHDHAAAYAALGHDHAGVYQLAGAYITAAGVSYANLLANGNVGSGASQVADGAHTHAAADVGLGNVENIKVKLDATTGPFATDDSIAGYGVGSAWFDVTNDKAYSLLDATASAAVWVETTQSAAGTTPGGSTGQVQFNDGGAFGGDSGLAYDKATDKMTIEGSIEVDVIAEKTSAAGVTVDGMLIKDGGLTVTGPATFAGATIADLGTVTTANIDGGALDAVVIGAATAAAATVSTLDVTGAATLDTVAEHTLGAGVTIETVLIKDGLVDGRDLAADGAAVDALPATPIEAAGVTFENLDANGDVGGGAAQVAPGDHDHAGVYQLVGAYITAAGVSYANLLANGDVGDGANQVADGTHNHDAAYAALGHDHAAAYAAIAHNHDAAYAALSHNHDAGDLNAGTLADARIAASNVTQHAEAIAAAIDAGSW